MVTEWRDDNLHPGSGDGMGTEDGMKDGEMEIVTTVRPSAHRPLHPPRPRSVRTTIFPWYSTISSFAPYLRPISRI